MLLSCIEKLLFVGFLCVFILVRTNRKYHKLHYTEYAQNDILFRISTKEEKKLRSYICPLEVIDM